MPYDLHQVGSKPDSSHYSVLIDHFFAKQQRIDSQTVRKGHQTHLLCDLVIRHSSHETFVPHKTRTWSKNATLKCDLSEAPMTFIVCQSPDRISTT